MLKHFVFVAIVLSSFITGIVEWSGCFEKADRKEKQVEAQERAKIEEPQVKEQSEAQVPKEEMKSLDRGMMAEEHSEVLDTCSALGRCICSLGLFFFAPVHVHLLQVGKGREPVLLHLLPRQRLQLLLARVPAQVPQGLR